MDPTEPRKDMSKWKPPNLTTTVERLGDVSGAATISRAFQYRGWSYGTIQVDALHSRAFMAARCNNVLIVVQSDGGSCIKGINNIFVELKARSAVAFSLNPFQQAHLP